MATDKLTRRQTLLAKVETTIGTDAVPTAGSNAVMILDGAAPAPGGERVGNARLMDTLSPQPHSIGMLVNGFTVPTEFRGGGATGDAVAEPDYAPLLKAAGFVESAINYLAIGTVSEGPYTRGETVEGGTSSATGVLIAQLSGGLLVSGVSGTFQSGEVIEGGTSGATASTSAGPVSGHQYTPTSDPDEQDAISVYYNYGGHLHQTVGARCDFSLSLPVGQPGKWDWTIRGRYVDPTDQSLPTVTLEDHLPPNCVNMGLVIGSYSPSGVNAITINAGNDLRQDKDVNQTDGLYTYFIADRTPGGSIDPKADNLSSFDPFAAWKAGTAALISGVVGSTAGNRIFFQIPQAQYLDPAYSNRDGRVTHQLSFECKQDEVGDDELKFCFF